MTNILFIYETEMPTVSITYNYWNIISKSYSITSKFLKLLDVKVEDVNWCDVLIMIRPNNAFSWRIAKKARVSGRFVITMCDDDLLNLPKSLPDLTWQRKGMIKALNQSDALMTNSKYIMDNMIDYTIGKRRVYIDTIVAPEELLIRNYEKEDNNIIKLVYAAGRGQHEILFEQYVLPSLIRVADKTSKKLSITFISVHPRCEELEHIMKVSYIEGMPLLEYRKYMEDQKFDIGVSPLEENSFTKCKYFNKYLEYTLSGIIGIYSNVEPYKYVVKDRINGFLADNTTMSWEEKLLEVIENDELRYKCAIEAQKQVKEKFNEDTLLGRLFSDVPEFIRSNSMKKECGNFKYERYLYSFFKGMEYLYKLLFYLRKEGFCSVMGKIKARIKK